MMSQVQVWVALIGGLLGIVGLVISNVYALTKFFSKMTARFDVLNSTVSTLKEEFRRDIDHLGTRLENAVAAIADNALSSGQLTVKYDGLERRVSALEESGGG